MKEIELAKVLWDYHHMHHEIHKADAIFVFGNSDLRTIYRGIELYNSGLSNKMIITGGWGKLTKDLWKEPEAHKFAGIAIENGVPKDAILTETAATNTGDNILFVRKILEEKGINYNSFILVSKPYMERRIFATFKKIWSEKDLYVTSPQLSFEEYIKGDISKETVINLMVGDLQRIKIYAEKGFQIPQEVPTSVWHAFDQLVALGYHNYLI